LGFRGNFFTPGNGGKVGKRGEKGKKGGLGGGKGGTGNPPEKRPVKGEKTLNPPPEKKKGKKNFPLLTVFPRGGPKGTNFLERFRVGAVRGTWKGKRYRGNRAVGKLSCTPPTPQTTSPDGTSRAAVGPERRAVGTN